MSVTYIPGCPTHSSSWIARYSDCANLAIEGIGAGFCWIALAAVPPSFLPQIRKCVWSRGYGAPIEPIRVKVSLANSRFRLTQRRNAIRSRSGTGSRSLVAPQFQIGTQQCSELDVGSAVALLQPTP